MRIAVAEMEDRQMYAVLLLLLFQDGPTWVNYSRIQLGMTRQDVARIVRQPAVSNITDADRFSVGFTMASHQMRQEGELWRSDTWRMWISFDKEQRVTGKMFELHQVDEVAEMMRRAKLKKLRSQ
jgi:septum formation inhibitor-activating ATPase MinD